MPIQSRQVRPPRARRGPPVRRIWVAAAQIAVSAFGIAGCGRGSDPAEAAQVAVSSSLLAAAVQEFLGPTAPVASLAEPGTCPGHFDVRPSQVAGLRSCRLLLRFDFQDGLDEPLDSLRRAGLRIAPVRVQRGFCVPDAYLDACRQTGAALAGAGLLSAAAVDERLAALEQRLAALATELRQSVAASPLRKGRVMVSGHQADFCRFLGLHVAAVFSGPERMSVGEIDAALRAGPAVALVIANEPEGTQMADVFAERLGAPLAVLGNFPGPRHGGRFDELVRENVRLLVAGGTP
jgi:zinc transport system substrate-binding protein